MPDEANGLIAVLLSRLNDLSDSVGKLAGSVLVLSTALPKVDILWEERLTAQGKGAQRAADVATLRAIPHFLRDYWPLVVGGILSALGIASRVWGWW